ncbi:MAG TPA: restriction endonuclease [Planctomycetota bacterium]|nr:restriction endonuclease [Planctomycetota bacterium]
MTLWLVRAGRAGEREQYALDHGLAVVGWDEMPDMAALKTKEEVASAYRKTHPESKPAKAANQIGQLIAFALRMQSDDVVVMPLKTSAALAIGTVAGGYEYEAGGPPGALHRRKVKWLRTDVPRASVDQDLLYSFGAFLTVCQVSRNDAEARVRALLKGKASVPSAHVPKASDDDVDVAVSEEAVDLERVAQDRIVARIQAKFSGHGLAALVEAVLIADGYVTKLSPPGADGGVDILAGSGPMGFGPPRLAVQVKYEQVDVTVLRTLQGSMQSFKAEQGLLVAWGGFKSSVKKEAAAHHFQIRLWDAGEVMSNLLRVYDRLSDDFRAELPLKRIWMLADEDE